MSLLMKALQQAAQNRGDKPAENVEPGGEPRSEPAAAPATHAAPGELSLEPIDPREGDPGLRPGLPPGSGREAAPRTGTRAVADGAVPAHDGTTGGELPGRTGLDARMAPARAAPGQARPTAASGTGRIGDPRSDSLDWGSDIGADFEPVAPAADRAGPVRPRAMSSSARRAAAGSPGSPDQAGALLAAGAGAARPGVLSQFTRLQWIVVAGLCAGLLLIAYFYLQINYPGFLQRGFRSPALSPPAAGPLSAKSAAQDAGAVSAAPSVPMTGVPPVPVPSPVPAGSAPAAAADTSAAGAAAPAPPALPDALAASPLLNPPTAAAAPPAARTVTSAPAPAQDSIPAAVRAPSASAAPLPPRSAASAGREREPAPHAAGSPAARPGGGAMGAAGTAPADSIRIVSGTAANPVNPALTEAYDHLQAGRIEPAHRIYQQLASADPRNIDALLGLAAIARLGNQNESAVRHYMRVLELDPRNAHAQASLIGLLGRADPVAAESQLKLLISREPSPFLYFTLGNLYADQNRWPLAQQAFFQAHHLQPGNADYAFNLAVGLERIAQPRLALNYLRIAMRLADSGSPASFDVAAARKRVSQLESTVEAQ